MSITTTSPKDYQKRIVVISQLVRLCEVCGTRVLMTSTGLQCISCGHEGYVEKWEHEIEDFRAELWEKEINRARELAATASFELVKAGGK